MAMFKKLGTKEPFSDHVVIVEVENQKRPRRN